MITNIAKNAEVSLCHSHRNKDKNGFYKKHDLYRDVRYIFNMLFVNKFDDVVTKDNLCIPNSVQEEIIYDYLHQTDDKGIEVDNRNKDLDEYLSTITDTGYKIAVDKYNAYR